jgi:hypothetical protein
MEDKTMYLVVPIGQCAFHNGTAEFTAIDVQKFIRESSPIVGGGYNHPLHEIEMVLEILTAAGFLANDGRGNYSVCSKCFLKPDEAKAKGDYVAESLPLWLGELGSF